PSPRAPLSASPAAVRQVRSRLRNAGGDTARPLTSAGPNELLLVALVHRLLVAAARNDAAETGTGAGAGAGAGADAAAHAAFDALSRTVRDAARRRDLDAVEEATVEHYLRQIARFL